MKLEDIIAGYVDLAEQAVAYRKATESEEEIRRKPRKVLASAGVDYISAYLAEYDQSVTAACISDIDVIFYSGKISLPYEPEKMEELEDKLEVARKKMLKLVLMQSMDVEGGEA